MGRVAGALTLTDAGTARAAALFEADRERWGAGPADAALDAFVPLDQRMKTTVTAWQMREVDGEQTFNDHSDADYDASVLQQLADLHADTETWLESLGTAVGRFAAYRGRFERAIAAVRAGTPGSSPHRGSTATTACGSSCTRT